MKSDFENFQEQRQHSLPGQPALMPDCPHGEKVSHDTQSETILYRLKPIASHHPTECQNKSLALSLIELPTDTGFYC